MIQAYDRSAWEMVLFAFRHFLANRSGYSRTQAESVTESHKKRLVSIAEHRKE